MRVLVIVRGVERKISRSGERLIAIIHFSNGVLCSCVQTLCIYNTLAAPWGCHYWAQSLESCV